MSVRKYYYINLPSYELRWAKIGIWIVISLFVIRLFHLQILNGNYYFKRAEINRIQYYYIPAPRGRIFDRRGEELVTNQPSYALYISRNKLTKEVKQELAISVEQLIGYSSETIMKKLNSVSPYPFGLVKIVPNLSNTEIAIIEENLHHLNNASIQMETRRKYLYAENASHLLGYISEINSKELSTLKKYGYKLKDKIGKSGIEKKYDKLLRGVDGFKEIEVEARGKQLRVMSHRLPVVGSDLLLTIDWKLQAVAQKTLGQKSGAVLAMDPSTGEILVWLSQPGYNPEDFTLPITKITADKLFNDPSHPLFDRTLQGQYAPGSIFKLVTSICSLEKDPENIKKEFHCDGSILIGYDKKKYRCWKDKKHGLLQLPEAIANSCNIYFFKLGMELGIEPIVRIAKKCGFTEASQQIFNIEKTGFLPTSLWKKSHFGGGWNPGDTANSAVGQGFVLVNPMQLLKFISMISNRGKMYRPFVVKMIVGPEGKVSKKFEPVLEKTIDFKTFTFDTIIDAMQRVVDHGTSKYLYLPDLDVAAKTGTAQTPSGEDNAWFACFAPASAPKIAIVVLVEHGGYGSVAALPIAREILREHFKDKM